MHVHDHRPQRAPARLADHLARLRGAATRIAAKYIHSAAKPDGLTLIRPEDLIPRIWPLPVGTINGVGPKAVQRLEQSAAWTVTTQPATPACAPR